MIIGVRHCLVALVLALAAIDAQEVPISTPIPGSFAIPFQLPLANGSMYSFDPRAISRPLVGFVHSEQDPFSRQVLQREDQLTAFFLQDPAPNVDVLALGVDDQSQHRVQKVLQAAVAKLQPAQQQFWQDRMLFANASVLALNSTAPSLVTLVQQWVTLKRQITWTTHSTSESVDRLDGIFQYCNIVEWDNHSPSSPLESYPPGGAPLVLVDNACGTTASLQGQFALVHMSQGTCTPDQAAKAVIKQGARGVLLLANSSDELVLLGQGLSSRFKGSSSADYCCIFLGSFEDQGLWDGNDDHGFCSMLPASASLLAAVKSGEGVNITYTTTPRLGAYFGFDHLGRYSEMGSPLNPTLMLVGWHAQYLEYLQRLDYNLSQPALTVPVFHPAIGEQASVVVNMPDTRGFNDLEMESRLSCEGAFDLDCDMWDHVHTVSVTCIDDHGELTVDNELLGALGEQDVQPSELGRWITPYRRRVGHWVTPSKQYLAQFSNAKSCNFTLAASDNGHPWVFELTLRFLQDNQSAPLVQGQPTHLFRLFNTSSQSTFDKTYNDRPTLSVPAPTTSGLHCYISAIITGHGSMEFLPSRHTFEVNGKLNVSVAYMEPLDQLGCAKKVREGVEPNGHGAIWFGRDGWCNGWKIAPWVVDITSAILPGENNKIRYFAEQYNVTTNQFTEPNASNGYMRLTSNLVFSITSST
eukprot:m.266606 g.266606  ORF g.266606 m.266606 type:complete len:696 (-) comp17630_c0_seq13:3-2090(-)